MRRGLRGAVLGFTGDPFLSDDPASTLRITEDALVVLDDGRIAEVRPWSAARARGLEVVHYPDAILCPGFIDCHVHYPQTQMIGAYGAQLLDWLDLHTFPAEQAYADPAHAAEAARVFLAELLRNGTTTAAVYCTVHPQSVEAFFTESHRLNTRMIAGKVLMDRNAPPALLDTAERGYEESRALIERWHGVGRQLYAITPRFAPTSTPAQLEAAGQLWREYPGTYLQTHLSENEAEIAWVRELFPERDGYLDVYHQAGLTGRRAVFGHAVHLSEEEFACCHRTGSSLAHCPSSNLFLGSGLFPAFQARRRDRPVCLGLGTDLGAGTSFSQLRTLGDAYKVAMGRGRGLTAAHGFWLATAGGAEALDLTDTIGHIAPGHEADLVVLDLKATPLLEYRMRFARDWAERLFVLMTLGDDRVVRATWVAGELRHDRDKPGAG
ncbi:guanine deaminase [Roseomonas marmotae]|uniref:Guanine deaminase n=1 Tax=Roseomonas marmotae TaxID=2768161 RepID=A0ABS3K9C1_9PROT|nr:guanine deaminase [Roseomonas marmotae]MBO1074067.1 guanine deaminase [Roseomonas marmotae]QTI78852.1 guanine deaminase [Roseomonas marmotae]